MLPVIFNVKISNFFFATLIGIIPQIFLSCIDWKWIRKNIDQNLEAPGVLDIITSPNIYIPLIIFVFSNYYNFLRKIFYKK